MKKRFSFLLAFLLAACLTVPAFAAGNPAVYDDSFTPPIPSFIRSYGHWYYGNGVQITCGFTGKLNFDYGSYPQDDAFPVVALLSQGCYNKYKEENGIDYDREYTLYYILLRKYHGSANDYSLGSFLHKGGPRHTMFMGSGNCMEYVLNSYFEYSFIKMDYNWEGGYFESKEDMHHVPQGSLSFFPFAYVLGVFSSDREVEGGNDFSIIVNGDFSESSEIYPNFGAVDERRFDVGTAYYSSESTSSGTKAIPHYRCYDWWIGVQGDDIPEFHPDTPLDKDTDGDGKPDLNVDTNGDGKPDINIDVNGDGLPEVNIDADGDGKADVNIDTDGDGRTDTNLDTDGDGKPDQNISGNGGSSGETPDINLDTDGDGKPDINIDTNGDGKPDLNVDTNGDGKPDINIDTDGDGKPDINIDTNGDRKPDINIDTDEDRKPDINIDTDGDGKPDQNIDIDGDGTPDVNVQPGEGSGGGSGEGPNPGPGGGGGSGPPSTWFEESDEELTYDAWEFFNPFQFDYTPFAWNKDYDPLEGYEPGRMPDFPSVGNPNSSPKDPFDVPNEIRFKDFVIQSGGQ